MLHSNLVYKFKCNICSDIYYSKIKRHYSLWASRYHTLNQEKGEKAQKKVQFLIILPIWVIMEVLMILKLLSKSVMNSDSSWENHFW